MGGKSESQCCEEPSHCGDNQDLRRYKYPAGWPRERSLHQLEGRSWWPTNVPFQHPCDPVPEHQKGMAQLRDTVSAGVRNCVDNCMD